MCTDTCPFELTRSDIACVLVETSCKDDMPCISGQKSDLIQRIAEHSSTRDDPHPISNPSSDQEDEGILGGLTVPQLKARLKVLGLPLIDKRNYLARSNIRGIPR